MSNIYPIPDDNLVDGDEILVYDDGVNFFIVFDSNGNVLVYDGV